MSCLYVNNIELCSFSAEFFPMVYLQSKYLLILLLNRCHYISKSQLNFFQLMNTDHQDKNQKLEISSTDQDQLNLYVPLKDMRYFSILLDLHTVGLIFLMYSVKIVFYAWRSLSWFYGTIWINVCCLDVKLKFR